MNTKRMMRWVIVLFLLATLPVMTAVMAQEQEPAEGPPVLTEPSESQAPEGWTWNRYEHVPDNGGNDTPVGSYESPFRDEFHITPGDVVGGKIDRVGDVDVYFFEPNWAGEPGHPTYFLMDIDAESKGSSLDAVVCVWVSRPFDPSPTACNDNADTHDSLLFHTSTNADIVFVGVFQSGNNAGGYYYGYQLSVSTPLLVSAAAANFYSGGTVDGIRFYSEDILAHSDLNNGEQKWVMFFDGSDVGIDRNVTNIAAHGGDELLLSLASKQTLPGVGTVSPWDIFIFDPVRYGPNTQGTFRWGMQGAEQGLTTASEKLDAIDGWVNGNDSCYGFPVSTTGIASVPSWNNHTVKQDDEDVFCKVYDGSWQPWRYFFDVKGKNNAPAWWVPTPTRRVPGLPAEDVTAMAYDDWNRYMYLVIQGAGNINGQPVTQKDVIDWAGGLIWHGPDHGWNYNIDAIEFNRW